MMTSETFQSAPPDSWTVPAGMASAEEIFVIRLEEALWMRRKSETTFGLVLFALMLNRTQ
jgi:hypothetical protein